MTIAAITLSFINACLFLFLSQPWVKHLATLQLIGCGGGSSSGRASGYELRGPQFDSHWELGFFILFSFLSLSICALSISGASFNRSLVEVQYYWFSTLHFLFLNFVVIGSGTRAPREPSTKRDSNSWPLEFLLSKRMLYRCAATAALFIKT